MVASAPWCPSHSGTGMHWYTVSHSHYCEVWRVLSTTDVGNVTQGQGVPNHQVHISGAHLALEGKQAWLGTVVSSCVWPFVQGHSQKKSYQKLQTLSNIYLDISCHILTVLHSHMHGSMHPGICLAVPCHGHPWANPSYNFAPQKPKMLRTTCVSFVSDTMEKPN